jgi:hypothetical protein
MLAKQKEMLEFLRGSRTCESGATACQKEKTSCPQKLKSDPDVREAVLKCQKLLMEEADVDAIG